MPPPMRRKTPSSLCPAGPAARDQADEPDRDRCPVQETAVARRLPARGSQWPSRNRGRFPSGRSPAGERQGRPSAPERPRREAASAVAPSTKMRATDEPMPGGPVAHDQAGKTDRDRCPVQETTVARRLPAR